MTRASLTRKLIGISGAVIFLVGSMVWTTRLRYSADAVLNQELGNQLVEIPERNSTDISEACLLEDAPEAWVLFVLDSILTPDNEFRTYFQTAEEPVGLFVEYDQGLLRLGLGLGAESAESNMELPIRFVRQKEHAVIVIGISREETRVIANGTDKSIAWPGEAVALWRCDSVQLANDSKAVPGGFKCRGCNSKLRYATGSELSELRDVLDAASNVRTLKIRQWVANLLMFVGAFLILRSFEVVKVRHNQSDFKGEGELSSTLLRRVIEKMRKKSGQNYADQ